LLDQVTVAADGASHLLAEAGATVEGLLDGLGAVVGVAAIDDLENVYSLAFGPRTGSILSKEGARFSSPITFKPLNCIFNGRTLKTWLRIVHCSIPERFDHTRSQQRPGDYC
jgi:hypothetical protein